IGSPANTLRSVSTTSESPAGPSVFWSISRSRKSSGSVSSRGLGFANGLDRFSSEHPAQFLNYQLVSGRTVCLLVNFQKPKVEWKRIVQGFGVCERLETPAVRGSGHGRLKDSRGN